jgi:hypothetical protein
MKRALALTLAIALHLPAHAGEVLPAELAGVWGTAASLDSGSAAQNFFHLEPDGFGFAVGSGAIKRPNGQAIEAVRSQAQLNQALASGPTPLDALTPYGKRRFMRGLRWGEHGLGGFSFASVQRELDPEQARAVLRFIDAENLLPMLSQGMVGPPLRLPAPSADIEQSLAEFERFASGDDERRHDAGTAETTLQRRTVLQRYRELFGSRMDAAALKGQPSGYLLPLFDAAALAAEKSPGSTAFGDLLLVHAELAARGVDTRRTLDDGVLHAMLAARRFEQARSFATGKPQLAHRTVPRVVDTLGPDFSGRSEFRYDAASATLTRHAFAPRNRRMLLMVVGEGCHFSRDALAAITGDAALLARLREAGLTLIVPPQSPIPLAYVSEWNAAHPELPIHIPAYPQEWQDIDVAGTPEFHLLARGKPVARRSGWPAGGNRAALAELLDKADRQGQ